MGVVWNKTDMKGGDAWGAGPQKDSKGRALNTEATFPVLFSCDIFFALVEYCSLPPGGVEPS